MAVIYTGYAQARGFQQINPHDSTPEKIQKAGAKKSAQQEKALNWRIKLAKQRQVDLQQTIQKQAKNRLETEQWRRDLNQQNFQREVNLQQSQMNREVQKAEQQNKQFEQLLAFTESGGKFLAEKQQKHRDAQKAIFRDAVERYGLDSNVIRSLNSGKRGVQGLSKQQQADINRLRGNGMPEDLIRQIHGMPTWLQIAVKEQDALTKSRQTKHWINTLGNEPLKLGNDTITYNSAKASGDPIKHQHAIRLLKQVIAERQGGVIDAKVRETSGAYRVEDQIWAQEYREASVHASHVAKEQAAEEVRLTWTSQLDQQELDEFDNPTGSLITPGQAYMNTIELLAGEGASRSELNLAREKLDNMILHDLEYGINDITSEIAELVSDHEDAPKFQFKNGAKKSIGDQWPKTRLKFEKAIGARLQHENRIASASANKWKAAAIEAEADSYQFLYEGDRIPSIEEIIQRHKAYSQKGFTKAAQNLQTYLAMDGANGVNDKSNILRIQAKIARGESFPTDYVKLLNFSNPALRAQAMSLISKHQTSVPTAGDDGTAKELDEWLKRTLEELVPRKNDFQESRESLAAMRRAKAMAVKNYKTFIIQNGQKHTEALKYTTDIMSGLIDSNKGLFRVDYDRKAKTRNFVNFRSDSSRDPLAFDTNKKVIQIRKDENYINNNAVLNETLLREKSTNLTKGYSGETILEAEVISRETGIPQHIIEQRQIEYYNANLEEGQSPIASYPDWYMKQIDDNLKDLSPLASRRLASQDPRQINLEYLNANKGMPYIDHTITRVGDTIKTNLTNNSGGYNSIDTEDSRISSEEKGFLLVNRTLKEIIDLNYPRAGAYRFTPELILKYAPIAGLNMESKFNRSNQDKLFEYIFKDLGNEPFTLDTVLPIEDEELLSSSYEAITSDKFDGSQWRSPAFMHKDVANAYKLMTMEEANA